MTPVEDLLEEHKSIGLMLGVLNEMSRRLESGAAVKAEHFDQALEFIRFFLERCHENKEETLLFFALEEAGVPREEVSMDLLVKEHRKGKQHINELAEVVARYLKGDRSVFSSISEKIRDYSAMLARHIEMEESVLYPAAAKRISGPRQDELVKEFELLETERLGPGKHDKLVMLIRRLNNFYLE